MEKLSPELIIPKKYDTLVRYYHRALRRLQKRINGGKSIRRQARQMKLSHTGLRNILRYPYKLPSRRTMIKVIRATSRPELRANKIQSPIRSWWVNDAI